LSALRNSSGGRTIVGSLNDDGRMQSTAAESARLQGPGYQAVGSEPIIELGSDAPGTFAITGRDPQLAKAHVDLNFVDTDVREFSRVFFAELLRRPYVVDQSVSGIVTVRSGGQVDGNAALSLARQALEATGNTIRLSDGVYRIASIASVGYDPNANVKTFALEHIDATAVQAALGGLIQGRAEIVSASGDSIVLRGDAETLSLIGSMLQVIDVDRFRSASFGLFPLRSAMAEDVTEELKVLYGGVGVSPQTMVAIDRINAVLVIASKPAHLEFAQKWIVRLDQAPQHGRQVYVYQVRNRDAGEVAKLMQEIFVTDIVAEAVVLSEETPLTAPGAFLGPPGDVDGTVRITADTGSNALVVWARHDEYELIERALQRLDTPLDQVYVEATIAEVRLGGELSHGVRWFLESGSISGGVTDASNGAVGASFPGFNFAFKIPQAQVVISALESHTDVRIVSTPQLTVIDRETATIQVGDQVPIVTKSVQDTSSGGNIIANDVAFRDTGVILRVTPQVRSSGDVLLKIEQEVSRVVPTTSSQINSPTISQRKVESTVLIPDGTAIVLAGLINSSDEDGGGGFPGTQKTFLESIFGSKKSASTRSELIVIIRPVIIRDRGDLREVAQEIAGKMQQVMQVEID
jgi:general secretion pathway protein D